MAKKIITISREFGSGGRFIGEEVAKKLGIKYYDKDIIGQIAEQSGFSPEYIRENAELSPKKGLFAYAFAGRDITGKSVEDMVYEAQRRVILELADKEPCVIIGRNADYILKDIKNCTSVYLYADREFRKNRVKEIYGSNAEIMDKEEKNRADYYNYYTGNRWGDINNYDFAINTSKVSFEEAADLIYRFAKDKQKNLKDR